MSMAMISLYYGETIAIAAVRVEKITAVGSNRSVRAPMACVAGVPRAVVVRFTTRELAVNSAKMPTATEVKRRGALRNATL
jgi:hypothetical protein